MTSMLEKAFSEAAKLPDMEQDALARWVLDEIESDSKWDTLFAESEDTLAQLASEGPLRKKDRARRRGWTSIIGEGLFELRVKSKEGIARAFFSTEAP